VKFLLVLSQLLFKLGCCLWFLFWFGQLQFSRLLFWFFRGNTFAFFTCTFAFVVGVVARGLWFINGRCLRCDDDACNSRTEEIKIGTEPKALTQERHANHLRHDRRWRWQRRQQRLPAEEPEASCQSDICQGEAWVFGNSEKERSEWPPAVWKLHTWCV